MLDSRHGDLPESKSADRSPALPPPINLLPRALRAESERSNGRPATPGPRPTVRGRWLYVGETKLRLRGVTYGTFADGEYPRPTIVSRDFAMMAANGVNAVRVYTAPPAWLLDIACAHGLYVMVGLAWEQHIAFLKRGRAKAIVRRVSEAVRECAGHPALLCFVVGNEIPASIVRWYGRKRVERFIARLCRAVKQEDPDALVTYVNYPSTEYLDLPFLDICCFNVFLEKPTEFEAYLARLQNVADERPLVLTELGLDSRRNGLEAQAQVVEWKLRETYVSGAAGAFVFAWTDEWHRGGAEIADWDFGLVDRDREPKPALAAARRAFADAPLRPDTRWPRVSVIVCAYNAEDTIEECLEGLNSVDYPDFETIVIDDGSTDATSQLVSEFDVRLISTDNQGLSAARNLGLAAATGEIVAYIDSDAFPDRDWLTHMVAVFLRTDHVGVGGPNVAPSGDSWTAQCVSASPGGPIHVLLSDSEAEHIPGCNMAFRKSALDAVGGFDAQYRVAGDDVDACWKVLDRGWTLGYSPGAVVWHHPRSSVRGYLKQQYSYGKAEALLERKWPSRYNAGGHLTWTGRVYGSGRRLGRNWRVYHGTWGGGLFQSLHERRPPHALKCVPLLPEWFLVIGALAALSSLAFLWTGMLPILGLLAVAVIVPVADASLQAKRVAAARPQLSRRDRISLIAMLASLRILQPGARLAGRLRHGLSPWRRCGLSGFSFPYPRTLTVWSEQWRAPRSWLERMEAALVERGVLTCRGGAYDRWELELREGVFGSVRMRMAVEEHGAGKQQLLIRLWPRSGPVTTAAILVLGGFAVGAAADGAWAAYVVLVSAALGVFGLAVRAWGRAIATLELVVDGLPLDDTESDQVRVASRRPAAPLPREGTAALPPLPPAAVVRQAARSSSAMRELGPR